MYVDCRLAIQYLKLVHYVFVSIVHSYWISVSVGHMIYFCVCVGNGDAMSCF